MRRINYADFLDVDIEKLCASEPVVLDFNLWDIPATMRRNVRKCAEVGAWAVTVSGHPYNAEGIEVAKQAGKEFGIRIIVDFRNSENWIT